VSRSIETPYITELKFEERFGFKFMQGFIIRCFHLLLEDAPGTTAGIIINVLDINDRIVVTF
jgi:hypothetical protein